MRKVLMATMAAGAIAIASPAIAAVTVADDPVGTPLASQIFGIASTGNPVFGSSPNNSNVPNVTYTSNTPTLMDISNGFATIKDSGDTPTWFEVIVNPDLAFTQMEFSIQLTGESDYDVYYLLSGSGLDANDFASYTLLATGSPLHQDGSTDKNYLIGGDSGESFDGIMIKVADSNIFEFKHNSYDPDVGPGTHGGVPEPSTWALMLLGFGGIGMALRRSRKRNPALMQVA